MEDGGGNRRRRGNGKLVFFLFLIILALVGYIFILKAQIKEQKADAEKVEVVELPKIKKVKVPLVSQTGGEFGPFGCGAYINFIEQQIPETDNVLDGVYSWIFSNPGIVGEYSNPVGEQTTVKFDRAEIVANTARVYLKGTIMTNECADATFAAQIEQASLQFLTVSKIEIYLNDIIFNWCTLDQSDGEGQCPETPKLWNTQTIKEEETPAVEEKVEAEVKPNTVSPAV
ncbi:MAG: hypothetical protein QG551_184 [Patescibacteria group bacterium]|nr:hypothetical protein [Patescibacteria group bacterium]